MSMQRPILLLLAFCATGVAAEPPTRTSQFSFPPHTFTVPDGYTVERVAGPPLVDRPITMSFDDAGALYVADSSGTNAAPHKQVQEPTHRIVRLRDRDGDGTFEERTVFAEGLSFPEGTLWHAGALYVAAPPQIWKFTDADGDGVAEAREVWFDGKTLTGCANDLHGPYAGLDGFIYWCKGAFAEQRHQLDGGRAFRSRASHVFRARPDGSGLDVVFTAGMDNPVDLAFSPAGELFVGGTFLQAPGPDGRDGIVHAIHGGVWGKEHNALDGHPRTGTLMPVMVRRGAAAASGLEMMRNTASGLRDDLLCAEFNMRRVSRHQLTPEGGTFKAASSDFLVSDQMDFHPTDVIEDADGSVLIADTGGWYKLCCPTSTLAKPDVLGAIYRVRRADAKRVDDPWGLKVDWARPGVALLADPRPKVVERAQAILASQGATAPLLEVLRSGTEARVRAHAVCALSRIATAEARAATRVALADSDHTVRSAAIHSTALWRDHAATDVLLAELESTDPHRCRLAAMALGRMADRRAVAPLLEAWGRSKEDRFVQHAIAYALYEIGDTASLPPDADNEPARIVRAMLATSEHGKTLPSVPAPKPAKAISPDPAAMAQQRSRLDALAAHLSGGDATRGAALFKDAKSLCITCHMHSGQGASFGPDLTKVGAIRSERDLLEAIVYPSASLVRSYEPVIVRTSAGESMGLLKRDSAEEIIVAASPGADVRIPRSAVRETEYASISLMPQVFDQVLSPTEIADLIAFLRSSK